MCPLAAALPSCVLGDLKRELTVLASELACATEAGRLATAAGDARVLPVRKPRTLGHEHGDPLDRLAYRRVFAGAAESFEIALRNAVAVAGPGIAAAALLRVADDPTLGLNTEQWEHLHRIAAELNPDVVEDLGGTNDDDTTNSADRPAGPAAG
ncbi:hypothetical protein ACFV0O_40940 [Kitasatospora sp. NPDC059577]|uniref:hypothetical protein n=1 Tax=Kitasatospora sp. NPDC059577 TaxID=3346873 RepID=UPI0036AEDA66